MTESGKGERYIRYRHKKKELKYTWYGEEKEKSEAGATDPLVACGAKRLQPFRHSRLSRNRPRRGI